MDKCDKVRDEGKDGEMPLSYIYDDGRNAYADYKGDIMCGGSAISDQSPFGYIYHFHVIDYEVFQFDQSKN